MEEMFYETGYNSTKLKTSITIRNPNTTSYNSMFYNVATKEGAEITVNYTSKTSSLVDKMIATKSEGANVVKGDLVEIIKDDIAIGDEIAIGSEHFYVISNDGTNVTLLTKYNLEVGSNCIYNSGNNGYQCTEIENPSGIQSEKALGYTQAGWKTTGNYGVVPFSSTNYWYSGGLLGKYGSSYPAYVYDENASIKTYVDNYKAYLEGLGVEVNSARLIKQEELVNLGCDESKYTCTTSDYEWLYTTTYWSGSASSNNSVWGVGSIGSFDFNGTYNISFSSGVRPVIVIPLSEI
jgi:hypothetical protein